MNKELINQKIEEWESRHVGDSQTMIPIRNTVIFPKVEQSLNIGRSVSLNALTKNKTKFFVLVYQKDSEKANPEKSDFYNYGTLCYWNIKDDEINPDDFSAVKMVGLQKVKITDFIWDPVSAYWRVKVEPSKLTFKPSDKQLVHVLVKKVLVSLKEHSKYLLQGSNAAEIEHDLKQINPTDPFQLVDFILKWFELDYEDAIVLIQATSLKENLERLLEEVERYSEKKKLEKKIETNMRKQLTKRQKEYFLRERIRAFNEELAAITGEVDSTEKLKKKLEEGEYPDYIKKKLSEEIKKYEVSPKGSADSNITRQYIDTLMNLPWVKETNDSLDLKKAKVILDKHHYGLEKVKERIIEHLAVIMRNKASNAKDKQTSIICLVGPPGIGKTSLGKSIAETMNRKFVRVSLGGVRDESEIRGHRKTYVGSMPGRIIKGMEKAGVVNPLFLLDEIDKMSSDFRGDPASAMLEVLDPEQNKAFSDNYIEEEYDLSKVLFICTANSYGRIPEPLLDRMEIIFLNSYTEQEKLQIAKRHLVSKTLISTGQTGSNLAFSDTGLLEIIRRYTREAGVRELQRMLEKVARRNLVENFSDMLDKKKVKKVTVTSKNIEKFLKKPIYDFQRKDKKKVPGLVNGLAYTDFGGDVLPIEVTYFSGNGKLILTGRLGDVFQESANISVGYIKSNAEFFKIDVGFFEKHDIHIHVPEGGVPKDGPSAGITITTAILSSILKKSVDYNMGMTGEITLRGLVLPIGGLKEKVISAHRSGLKKVVIPKGNEKDIDEIPEEVRESIEIKLMESYMDVYKESFKK